MDLSEARERLHEDDGSSIDDGGLQAEMHADAKEELEALMKKGPGFPKLFPKPAPAPEPEPERSPWEQFVNDSFEWIFGKQRLTHFEILVQKKLDDLLQKIDADGNVKKDKKGKKVLKKVLKKVPISIKSVSLTYVRIRSGIL
eukprot:COSAG02_NODE_30211_length_555_cov_1.017544_1_plen_142_part_01